jgi:transcriptional regulator with XRE-family HTH domain
VPKPTSHPIGSVIRERRMAKGLSLAQLAEKIGIGPTSVSLVAAMEHGAIPPRRDVAESLAAVLELDPEPLLMWADTRMSPRAAIDALHERARLEARFNQQGSPLLARGALRASLLSRAASRDADLEDALAMPSLAGSAADAALNQIPILPSGADPDRYRRKPLGYLDRVAIERLIAGRAELIRPIAYELSDEDFERLRRVVSPHGRPLHALVSRPLPIVVDAREPYAIRFEGRVILAYCAWDGRELVVLQPPKHRGFARLKAKRESDLEEHIVGQVVTLNWWEPIPTP